MTLAADGRSMRLTQAGEIDRRMKACPLNSEQAALAAAQAEWVRPWVYIVVPRHLIQRIGIEECVAEAWEIIVRAASIWELGRGATFKTFAQGGVKRFLPPRLSQRTRNRQVWQTMPRLSSEVPVAEQLADHRTEDRDPLLRVWCEDENCEQRRELDWKCRLILYLRFVECWTLQEVGQFFGVTRARIQQVEAVAHERLALSRVRRNCRKAAMRVE